MVASTNRDFPTLHLTMNNVEAVERQQRCGVRAASTGHWPPPGSSPANSGNRWSPRNRNRPGANASAVGLRCRFVSIAAAEGRCLFKCAAAFGFPYRKGRQPWSRPLSNGCFAHCVWIWFVRPAPMFSSMLRNSGQTMTRMAMQRKFIETQRITATIVRISLRTALTAT